MFYYLFINNNLVDTIESNIVPNVGDIISYNDIEYTVKKIKHIIRKDKHVGFANNQQCLNSIYIYA